MLGQKNLGLKAPAQDQDIESRLIANFKHASYGSFFRTRAYKVDRFGLSEAEWREAHLVPNYGWIIKTASKYLNEENKAQIKYSVVNPTKGYSFFEAVKSLAVYEAPSAQNAPPVEEDAELDISKLGDAYYKNFAEREGLVFDTTGFPHPTQAGYIVSSANFMEGTQEKSIALSKQRDQIRLDVLGFKFRAIDPAVWNKKYDAMEGVEALADDMSMVVRDLSNNGKNLSFLYEGAYTGKIPKNMDPSKLKWFNAAKKLMGKNYNYIEDKNFSPELVYLDAAVRVFRYIVFTHVAAVTKRHVEKGCSCVVSHKSQGCYKEDIDKFNGYALAELEALGLSAEKDIIHKSLSFNIYRGVASWHEEHIENISAIQKHVQKIHEFIKHEIGIAKTGPSRASIEDGNKKIGKFLNPTGP